MIWVLITLMGCLEPPPTEYADIDGDGYGNEDVIVDWGEGVPFSNDCDDTDPTRFPTQVWALDCDGDGAYENEPLTACEPPDGCNGLPVDSWPNGEVSPIDCDDSDASGLVATDWYPDCDGDGIHAAIAVSACGISAADDAFDCANEADPPGADNDRWSTEVGTDCDDEDPIHDTRQDWFPDCDDDEVHSAVAVSACNPADANQQFSCASNQPPPGEGTDAWVTTAGSDCDDEDVDHYVDTDWFPDCDDDDAHSTIGVFACNPTQANLQSPCDGSLPPPGDGDDAWVTVAGADCDDHDNTKFPGQVWYADCDDDGAFTATVITQCDEPTPCLDSSTPPAGGWSRVPPLTDDADCDDNYPLSFPGADEHCDAQQNDCRNTTWTNDRDIVSFEAASNGLWSLVSDDWQAGTADNPATIQPVDAGILHVCPAGLPSTTSGENESVVPAWYVDIVVNELTGTPGTPGITFKGEGDERPRLSGGNLSSIASFNASTAAFTRLDIRDGMAEDGGALSLQNGSTVVVTDSVLRDNEATQHGGVAWVDSTSTLTIREHTEMAGNTAALGSVAYTDGGTLELTDSTVSENSGSALFLQGERSFGDFDTTTFTSNTAAAGAAVYITDGQVEMDGCSFTSNTATGGQGGAIRVQDAAQATIVGGTFTSNVASNGGGAMFANNGTITLTDSTFSMNTATSGNGGAITVDGGTVTMTRGGFDKDNANSGSGGAIHGRTQATVTLEQVTVETTRASIGGALGMTTRTNLSLNGVDIRACDNSAIALSQFASATIEGGLISDGVGNGAIRLSTNGTLALINADFENNGTFDLQLVGSSTQTLTLGSNETRTCTTESCD